MSAHDEPDDAELEKLLRIAEEEEARALRNELTAFLRSDACKREIEAVVREPLEKLVRGALRDPDFQTAIGAQLLASLQPEITKAAGKAANAALKDVTVHLTEEWQRAIRAQAEEALKKAFADAQKGALDAQKGALEKFPTLNPDLWEKVQKKTVEVIRTGVVTATGTLPTDWMNGITAAIRSAVNTEVEAARLTISALAAAVPGAAPPPPPPAGEPKEPAVDKPKESAVDKPKESAAEKPIAPKLGRSWKGWRMPVAPWVRAVLRFYVGGPLLLALIIFITIKGYQYIHRSKQPTAIAPSATATTTGGSPSSSTPSPPPKTAPSLLSDEYRAGVAEAEKNFPAAGKASAEEMACVEKAINKAWGGRGISFATLQADLSQCPTLKLPPPAASLHVAVLQRQLENARVERKERVPISVDAKTGDNTKGAFTDWKKKQPPSELKNLSDYVAAVVVLLHERDVHRQP